MKTYTITQEQLDEGPAYKYPGVSEPGEYTYYENDNLYRLVLPKTLEGIVERVQEYNRKVEFGIGSLGRHVETPTIPTVAQMERMEHIESQTKCRKCGGSEWTGAMFTTDPGSGLCDDCFG